MVTEWQNQRRRMKIENENDDRQALDTMTRNEIRMARENMLCMMHVLLFDKMPKIMYIYYNVEREENL